MAAVAVLDGLSGGALTVPLLSLPVGRVLTHAVEGRWSYDQSKQVSANYLTDLTKYRFINQLF